MIIIIQLNALDYRPTNAAGLYADEVLTTLAVVPSDRSNPTSCGAFILQSLFQADFRFIVAGTAEGNLEISVSWKNRVRATDTSFERTDIYRR